MYQSINQVKTGAKLKMMLKAAGYDVRYIQEYLHFSCPQSIYRWFKGKALPSVDNLFALSQLLDAHMEDLLVLQGEFVIFSIMKLWGTPRIQRFLPYAKHCYNADLL